MENGNHIRDFCGCDAFADDGTIRMGKHAVGSTVLNRRAPHRQLSAAPKYLGNGSPLVHGQRVRLVVGNESYILGQCGIPSIPWFDRGHGSFLPALRPESWRDVEFGMVITAIALIVPATWYHHYALLAIPIAILISCAETRVDFALAFIAWSAISIFGVTWHALVGHTLLLDMGTIGAFMLWLALARMSRRVRSRSFSELSPGSMRTGNMIHS